MAVTTEKQNEPAVSTGRRRVWIIDTTLRDGEQAPGVAFSLPEKRTLLRLLDRAGVDELEVGTPAMGPAACEEIRELAALQPNCLLTSWCRALEKDIEKAADCGTQGVHISFPVSSILLEAVGRDQLWVLDQLAALVPLALERFQLVSVGAQDAFRASAVFLNRFVRHAAACGAHRVRIADTVGLARPSQVAAMVTTLTPLSGPSGFEFHGHNDLGMATANTIAAIEAGVGSVSVTVNGLGERAGNAPLEQVAVATHTLAHRYCAVDPKRLMTLCRFVSRITNRPIAVDQPISGDGVFSHESGIHCAALLKDPTTYQPFDPKILGRQGARLVVGQHSGSRVVQHVMEKAGVKLNQAQAERFLTVVRTEAARRKSNLSAADLARLCAHACI